MQKPSTQAVPIINTIFSRQSIKNLYLSSPLPIPPPILHARTRTPRSHDTAQRAQNILHHHARRPAPPFDRLVALFQHAGGDAEDLVRDALGCEAVLGDLVHAVCEGVDGGLEGCGDGA